MEVHAKRLYRAPLRFETEETSHTDGSVTFCDKEVTATWERLWIRRKDPNRRYVLGLDSFPKKIRYPCFLGHRLVRSQKMKAWMRSTFYAELSSELPEMQTLGALRCMAELQLAGYPTQTLKTLVGAITQTPLRGLRQSAQRYLRMCKMEHGGGPFPRERVHEIMLELHRFPETSWDLLAEQMIVPADQRGPL